MEPKDFQNWLFGTIALAFSGIAVGMSLMTLYLLHQATQGSREQSRQEDEDDEEGERRTVFKQVLRSKGVPVPAALVDMEQELMMHFREEAVRVILDERHPYELPSMALLAVMFGTKDHKYATVSFDRENDRLLIEPPGRPGFAMAIPEALAFMKAHKPDWGGADEETE